MIFRTLFGQRALPGRHSRGRGEKEKKKGPPFSAGFGCNFPSFFCLQPFDSPHLKRTFRLLLVGMARGTQEEEKVRGAGPEKRHVFDTCPFEEENFGLNFCVAGYFFHRRPRVSRWNWPRPLPRPPPPAVNLLSPQREAVFFRRWSQG